MCEWFADIKLSIHFGKKNLLGLNITNKNNRINKTIP